MKFCLARFGLFFLIFKIAPFDFFEVLCSLVYRKLASFYC